MSTSSLGPGAVLDGRFRIASRIGKGSFGMVFAAKDQARQGALVAIKMLKPAAMFRETLVERFRREARICGELQHPGVVTCHHVGHVTVDKTPEPVPYMALDLVQGLSLRQIIQARGPLWVQETIAVFSAALEGLQYVHDQGYVHRDLKPDNILVAAPVDRVTRPKGDGTLSARLGIPEADDPVWRDLSVIPKVRLVDFGLAKKFSNVGVEDVALTREGQAAGTAEYMSPEQVVGAPDVDGRSDVYAMAMLLYRVLTGWAPFRAERQTDIAVKHLTDTLPALPHPLDNHRIALVYRRAGDKDRALRFQTAREMADAMMELHRMRRAKKTLLRNSAVSVAAAAAKAAGKG